MPENPSWKVVGSRPSVSISREISTKTAIGTLILKFQYDYVLVLTFLWLLFCNVPEEIKKLCSNLSCLIAADFLQTC